MAPSQHMTCLQRCTYGSTYIRYVNTYEAYTLLVARVPKVGLKLFMAGNSEKMTGGCLALNGSRTLIR